MNKNKETSNTVLFIGGIGNKNTFGGELTKNKLIIERLEEYGKKVITEDTHHSRGNHGNYFCSTFISKVKAHFLILFWGIFIG